MRSYSKKMRPGREVILLTPRYYVFSLRGETGDSETRHYMWGHQRRQGKNTKKLPKRANIDDQ
jgi:hypothetical protein